MNRRVAELEPEVAKFVFHLSRRRRRRFDEDWADFKSHAAGLSWNRLAARTLYPSMTESNQRDPKEEFYGLAAKLLAYAGET